MSADEIKVGDPDGAVEIIVAWLVWLTLRKPTSPPASLPSSSWSIVESSSIRNRLGELEAVVAGIDRRARTHWRIAIDEDLMCHWEVTEIVGGKPAEHPACHGRCSDLNVARRRVLEGIQRIEARMSDSQLEGQT